MKIIERVVIVMLLFCLIGGSAWVYFGVKQDQVELREAVERGEFEIREPEPTVLTLEDWRLVYPNTEPIMIASTSVQASVADSLPERIKGLSDTPFLPEDVVKLFDFGTYGSHEIWMKDMNYPIDIVWADSDGVIVHIEENVAPESYERRETFGSPVPAWYVVETAAGFVETHNIAVGDKVTL
jgi:uncharacterized membrane protein (UPF0127 family)